MHSYFLLCEFLIHQLNCNLSLHKICLKMMMMASAIRRRIADRIGTLALPFSLDSSIADRRIGTRHFASLLRVDFSTIKDMHFANFLFDAFMRVRPRASVSLFNSLLNAVAKLEEYRDALSMFDKMRQLDMPIDIYTMTIAINCYCHVNRVELGFAMLGCIFKLGYEPDLVTFNTLAKGLCLNDKVMEAEKLLTDLLAHNHNLSDSEPNAFMIGLLVKRLCKDGDFEDALQLLLQTIDKGIRPDITTYCPIIQGLCEVGRWKDVIQFFKKMVSRKLSLVAFDFHTLINALCKEGMVKEAVHFVENMIQQNIRPCIITYTILIDGYCSQGQIDEAIEIFHYILNQGVKPDIVTFSILIKGLCKKGMVREAEHVMDIMIQQSISPCIITYTTLIDGYCKKGMVQEAEHVMEIMIQQNISPNTITYTTLIDWYCSQGLMDEAEKLFHSIVNQGLKPDIVVYNTLMKGYYKKGKVVQAWYIFGEVLRKGLQPTSVTYKIMLHGLFDKGWKLFSHMEAQHVPLDVITCNVFLDGLVKSNHIEKAISFLCVMEDRGLYPDVVTYGTLVDGLCAHGRLDAARDILNQLPSKGLQPNVVMYNMIVASLCRKGLTEEAKCNLIIRGLVKGNKLYKAMPFLEEMKKQGFMLEPYTASLLSEEERHD